MTPEQIKILQTPDAPTPFQLDDSHVATDWQVIGKRLAHVTEYGATVLNRPVGRIVRIALIKHGATYVALTISDYKTGQNIGGNVTVTFDPDNQTPDAALLVLAIDVQLDIE